MKGEELYILRSKILDSMSFILLSAPHEFPAECKTNLEKERRELLSHLEQHRAVLKAKEQLVWHSIAEQEAKEALDAYAAGERKRGADLIQRAEDHFRKSFRTKRIRPGFIVGGDGQAVKT